MVRHNGRYGVTSKDSRSTTAIWLNFALKVYGYILYNAVRRRRANPDRQHPRAFIMIALNQNSRPGRKPLLDEVKRGEICEILAIGGTRTLAARYVGCSLDTIARTAERDRAFAKQLRKASVECEIRCLRSLQNAAQDPTQWRAAAWTLERLYPERYARRVHGAVTHEQLRQVIGRLRRQTARVRVSRRRPADRSGRNGPLRVLSDLRGKRSAAPPACGTEPRSVLRSAQAPPRRRQRQNRPAKDVESSGEKAASAPQRPDLPLAPCEPGRKMPAAKTAQSPRKASRWLAPPAPSRR